MVSQAGLALPGGGRFKVTARDLGGLKPGLALDNIAEFLEQVEGPAFR